MLPNPLLVATDLDGTLLDHDTYAYETVLPLLRELQSAGVPIVLATSKTRPEVEQWQARLGLASPYIVENGSAAVFADGTEAIFGARLPELVSFLAQYAGSITSFIDCPLDEAVKLTGLTESEAKLARNRQYSLPFILHEPALATAMQKKAAGAGLKILRGGRFLHLQGQCDKYLALQQIKSVLDEEVRGVHRVIALGDNQNDLEMLQHADVAVVMNTKTGHQLELAGSKVIYTQATAPEGWVEGLQAALASIA